MTPVIEVTQPACREPHPLKRVVLTGGPGAGKTAVLELLRRAMCEHVRILPEAAGILFGGGFPRGDSDIERRAAQRAIYHVQRELEEAALVGDPAILLCDRGTIDGAAYWPGYDTLWSAVGTTRGAELARYSAVIHLRTPSVAMGYARDDVLRVETASEAARVDMLIEREWDGHPRRSIVEATTGFIAKAVRAIELVRAELPDCCRAHPVPLPNADPAVPDVDAG